MYTRFRDCGTPKFLLLSTCQHTSYPSSVQAVLTRFQPQAVKNSHAMLHLLSPKSLMLFGDPVFNVLRIVSNVLPESWLSRPGTFSRKIYLGFLTAAILAISKNNVPLVSSNPFLAPAIEKLWQGNPPVIRSKSGNCSGTIFRLYTKCWGKERAYKINLKIFKKSRAYFPKIR